MDVLYFALLKNKIQPSKFEDLIGFIEWFSLKLSWRTIELFSFWLLWLKLVWNIIYGPLYEHMF